MHVRWTRRLVATSLFITIAFTAGALLALRSTRWAGAQEDGSFLIPTGQQLTPAGEHIEVNDRPLGMKFSPAGGLLAVVTGSNFDPRALHIIDAAARTLKQTLPIGDS